MNNKEISKELARQVCWGTDGHTFYEYPELDVAEKAIEKVLVDKDKEFIEIIETIKKRYEERDNL